MTSVTEDPAERYEPGALWHSQSNQAGTVMASEKLYAVMGTHVSSANRPRSGWFLAGLRTRLRLCLTAKTHGVFPATPDFAAAHLHTLGYHGLSASRTALWSATLCSSPQRLINSDTHPTLTRNALWPSATNEGRKPVRRLLQKRTPGENVGDGSPFTITGTVNERLALSAVEDK